MECISEARVFNKSVEGYREKNRKVKIVSRDKLTDIPYIDYLLLQLTWILVKPDHGII